MNLIHLIENIYVLASGNGEVPRPNIGIIPTREGTILIDSGNSPDHAQKIKDVIKEIKAPPVCRIIYTHWHWDHVFGACSFPEAQVLGSRKTYDYLKEEAARSWSERFIYEDIKKRPEFTQSHQSKLKAIKDWSDFKIVIPQITFEASFRLLLGETELELRKYGGKHSDDATVITDRKRKVMFLGDSYYPPPVYADTPDTRFNVPLLEEFLNEGMASYVQGHGRIHSPESFSGLLLKLKKRQDADFL